MKLDKKNETVRNLRVIYTDAERLELGKQLAGAHQDLAQTNNDLDSVKQDFKARITAHEAKIGDLSNKVATGHRVEQVKCLWNFDEPKKGQKTLSRVDTFDVVEVVDMTEADKQGELAIGQEDLKAGVAGDGNVTVAADKK